MSSKRRKNSPFNAPSQVTEKYLDSLNRARADETYQSSESGTGSGAISGTDAPLGDAIAPPHVIKREWKVPKWLITVGYVAGVASVLGILIGIVLFFYNMNAHVYKANEKIVSVETKVDNVEGRVENIATESKDQQNQIRLNLTELKGMLDRILDNVVPQRSIKQGQSE